MDTAVTVMVNMAMVNTGNSTNKTEVFWQNL